MQVIFIKDLKGQGKKGEIKEVSNGYGMNFLIKKGYAVLATDTGVKRLNEENKLNKEKEEALIKECEILKGKLEKTNLKFKVKCGKTDMVFGSISAKQIVSSLKKEGYDIDKKKIKLDNPINCLGYTNVEIDLHKKVKAVIRIELIKES